MVGPSGQFGLIIVLYILVAKGTQNHCDAFRRCVVLSRAKTNAPQRAVPSRALLCFLTPTTPHASFRLQCGRSISCGLRPYRLPATLPQTTQVLFLIPETISGNTINECSKSPLMAQVSFLIPKCQSGAIRIVRTPPLLLGYLF